MSTQKNKPTVCVLVSGGLDSGVLLAELARSGPVQPIYVSQGMAWEDVELFWLQKFLKAVESPSLRPLKLFFLPMGDVYGRHWSLPGKVGDPNVVPGSQSPDRAVYLPGRNLVLLVKTAVYCSLNKISKMALGSLGNNPFPDASPAFFKLWSKTLQTALKTPLTILTPYRTKSKGQVIQRGRDLPLELTFSCLAPVGTNHCGRCNKCAERIKAFKKAGVTDPTSYASA